MGYYTSGLSSPSQHLPSWYCHSLTNIKSKPNLCQSKQLKSRPLVRSGLASQVMNLSSKISRTPKQVKEERKNRDIQPNFHSKKGNAVQAAWTKQPWILISPFSSEWRTQTLSWWVGTQQTLQDRLFPWENRTLERKGCCRVGLISHALLYLLHAVNDFSYLNHSTLCHASTLWFTGTLLFGGVISVLRTLAPLQPVKSFFCLMCS